jgi:hypothetical protein
MMAHRLGTAIIMMTPRSCAQQRYVVTCDEDVAMRRRRGDGVFR